MDKFVRIKIFFILLLSIILHKIIYAQGQYFNLTVDGSYSTSYTADYKNTKSNLGVELSLPLGNFFELSFGESYTRDIYEYTDEYKNELLSKGVTLPAGKLTQEYDTMDSFSNLSFGLFSRYIAPSIFGGILNRQIYYRDYYGNEISGNEGYTWNAGAALSIYMGRYLRLKTTYRISPSMVTAPSGKYYDESFTVGLTISI